MVLFYFTATSTVYCHNEMLWGYIPTSSSSTFDIKRESSGEKGVRRHQHQVSGPAQRNQRTTMEARTGSRLSQPEIFSCSQEMSLLSVECWMLSVGC